MTHLLMTKSE